MNPMLVGFVRNDSPGLEVDFSEKLGNFSFGLLRLAFGKSYEVKVVDGITSFDEFSHGKAVRVFAFILMIITAPITFIPGLLVCTGCISSESYEAISKLYQKTVSLDPPPEDRSSGDEKTTLSNERVDPPPELETGADALRPLLPSPLPDQMEVGKSLAELGVEIPSSSIAESSGIGKPKRRRVMLMPASFEGAIDAANYFPDVKNDPYFCLPQEARLHILSYLNPEDLINFTIVSKDARIDALRAAIYRVEKEYNQILSLINHLASIDRATIHPATEARKRHQDSKLVLRKNGRWELFTRNLDRVGANEGKRILKDYFNDLTAHFFEYAKINKTFKNRLFAIQKINNKILNPLQKKLIQEIKKLYDEADATIAPIAEQFNDALAVVNHLRSVNSSTLTLVISATGSYEGLMYREYSNWKLSREHLVLIGSEEGGKLFEEYSKNVVQCLAGFAKTNRVFKTKLSSLQLIGGKPMKECQKVMIHAIIQASEAAACSIL